MKLRAQVILPILYVAFALYGWVDFVSRSPDGLANVGLFLITLPVTILTWIFEAKTGNSAWLMPQGDGYIADHALYYFPAVVVTALIWWLIGRGLDRLVGTWRAS